MKGYLIVNSFMKTEKFISLYEMLSNAFKNRGVSLEIKQASDISLKVGEPLKEKVDFAIFWTKTSILLNA